MLPDYSLEARLIMLKHKQGPPPAPLTRAEKLARTMAESDRIVVHRLGQLKAKGIK